MHFAEPLFLILPHGGQHEAHIYLAHPERFGHQRSVLVGEVGIFGAEPALFRRMDQQHGRRTPQDTVVALGIFAAHFPKTGI